MKTQRPSAWSRCWHGLLCAGAAALPASAGTPLQLYGLVDQAVEHVDGRAGAPSVQVGHVWGASRLGLRLNEALAPDWRVRAAIEHRFSADSGAQVDPRHFFSGQSWLGVEGPAGALRLGRDYTPLEQALGETDLSDQSFYFDNIPRGATARADHLLQLHSPSALPLRAVLALASSQGSGEGRLLGLALFAGDDDALLQAAGQQVDRSGGRQNEWSLGLVQRGWPWSWGLTLGRVDLPDGSRNSALHLSASLRWNSDSVFLSLKREAIGSQPQTLGAGLALLHGLSKTSFLYLALSLQSSPHPDGRHAAVGLRSYF